MMQRQTILQVLILILGLSQNAKAGIGPDDKPLQMCLTKMEAARDFLKMPHAPKSFLKVEGNYTERGIRKVGTYYFGSTAWQFFPNGYRYKSGQSDDIEPVPLPSLGLSDRSVIQVSANKDARRAIANIIHDVAMDLMDSLKTAEGQRIAKGRSQSDKDLIAEALKACNLASLKDNSYQIKSLYSKSVEIASPTEGTSGLLKKETEENPSPKGYVTYIELLSGTEYQHSPAKDQRINN